MNLPDKDFDSRYVMACEDAWDYQICLHCVLGSRHVPDFPCHLSGKRVCVESMSLQLQTRMHLMVFHFRACVSREHMCLSASALASVVLSPFQASLQDLLVPLRPGLVHS